MEVRNGVRREREGDGEGKEERSEGRLERKGRVGRWGFQRGLKEGDAAS